MNHLSNSGKEIKRDSQSSGERNGKSPNQINWGCRAAWGWPDKLREKQFIAERFGKACQSVWKPRKRNKLFLLMRYLSTAGHVEPCRNLGRPRSKAKYYTATDSEQVPWGKGEKNPGEGSEIEPETMDQQDVTGRKPCSVPFVEWACELRYVARLRDSSPGAVGKPSLNRARSCMS